MTDCIVDTAARHQARCTVHGPVGPWRDWREQAQEDAQLHDDCGEVDR